jgi:hypothetical protein
MAHNSFRAQEGKYRNYEELCYYAGFKDCYKSSLLFKVRVDKIRASKNNLKNYINFKHHDRFIRKYTYLFLTEMERKFLNIKGIIE